MNEWLKTQAASGFPAFAGSSIAGTLVVRDDLLNELLAHALDGGGGGEETTPAAATVDLAAVRPLIKRVSIRSEQGRLLIDFAASV
jgi:hypothetical protein